MFSAARKRSPSQTAADWSSYSGLPIVLFQADSEPLLLFQCPNRLKTEEIVGSKNVTDGFSSWGL